MCSKIKECDKLQTSKLLPNNVAFCFLEPKTNPDYQGLLLVSAEGKRYKSVEEYKSGEECSSKLDLVKVYSYLGLKHLYTPATRAPASLIAVDEPCGKCSNCTKPRCKECVCCRENNRAGAPGICCYQKVSRELLNLQIWKLCLPT
jgi:hypothetical protein